MFVVIKTVFMKIFIVENDSWYASIIAHHLSLNPDYEVEKFETGTDCLNNLYKNPTAVTIDSSLPDMSGVELLKKIKKSKAKLPVIVISGQGDISSAVELLRAGAYDYLSKDEDTKEKLWNRLNKLQENISLKEENEQLKEEIGKKYKFTDIIKGNSKAIKDIFKIIEKASDSNITVSITGETGTGKDLVAKSIHYHSNRKSKSFIALNVNAVPKELIESELFGHEKGAFTGATSRRIGKFEQAHKGTLFLDEIAEMDFNMQTKLLRVLQEKEIVRVGGNQAVKVDVKLITATNKNLANEVKKGNFRKDLYYRLLGIPIVLPPLRDRKDDILLLAKHFADDFCKENKKPKVTINQEAKQKLIKYLYPGNVRELKAAIEMAIVMANEASITADDITFHSLDSVSDFLLQETSLENYNVQIINHFLEKYDNNAIQVAKKLQVAKSTIYRIIKKHQLI